MAIAEVALRHMCVPGAAGIARRGAREVAESAPGIRLVTFFEWGGSQGEPTTKKIPLWQLLWKTAGLLYSLGLQPCRS